MVVLCQPKGPCECSVLAKEIRCCSRVEVLVCKEESKQDGYDIEVEVHTGYSGPHSTQMDGLTLEHVLRTFFRC